MKRNFVSSFILLLFFALRLNAANLTIIVTSIPANTPPGDNIYIAGNFNGWNPGNPDFMLTANALSQLQIVLEGTGNLEFKFTRGSWETVEGGENGGFLPNRTFTFGTADTLLLSILSWEDTGGATHTAAENVIVMDEDFEMPQFNRTRRIWLLLPLDYETSGKSYPVLYMHDGQNLFDIATSFAGEWEVDESLNEFFNAGKDVPIVVGIDNGGADRIAEYTPWANPNYGGGDGDKYAKFIVETLKPYIDANYRTKPGRENTGVMGSSLGGLISFYIAVKYQDIFSKAGIFSPSFWYSDSCYTFASATGKHFPMQFYIMGGNNESGGLVQEMENMIDTLFAAGFGEEEIKLKVIPGGQHNEYLWRTQFPDAYEWLFLNPSNEINGNELVPKFTLKIVNGRIFFENHLRGDDSTGYLLKLFSTDGRQVFENVIHSGESLALNPGLKGIFVAHLSGDGISLTKKVLQF
jgi:predicted alpha/beta superfamily hydrolase